MHVWMHACVCVHILLIVLANAMYLWSDPKVEGGTCCGWCRYSSSQRVGGKIDLGSARLLEGFPRDFPIELLRFLIALLGYHRSGKTQVCPQCVGVKGCLPGPEILKIGTDFRQGNLGSCMSRREILAPSVSSAPSGICRVTRELASKAQKSAGWWSMKICESQSTNPIGETIGINDFSWSFNMLQ